MCWINRFGIELMKYVKSWNLFVKVLKVVDQDKKPTMPYIYEAMDKAKRSIETISTLR